MDREKVIKGLECLITDDVPCNGCPYNGSGYCIKNISSDALVLLKEHEAVEPIAKEDSYECICGAIVGWDELDASGIVQTRFNYCPFCGKPILWEGRRSENE